MSVMNQEKVDLDPVVDESAEELVYLGLPMRITIGAFVVVPLLAVAVYHPSYLGRLGQLA